MNYIEKMVKKLKKKYNTSDPRVLCEYLNIAVFEENLGNIKGFYQAAPKNKIIHININLSRQDKKWTYFHEIGHALLHSNLNILFLEKQTYFVKNKFEREADLFCAHFLINDDILYNYEGKNLEYISKCENIPLHYLKLRFNK